MRAGLEVMNELIVKSLKFVLPLQCFSLKKKEAVKYQISKFGVSSQAEGEHLGFACLS